VRPRRPNIRVQLKESDPRAAQLDRAAVSVVPLGATLVINLPLRNRNSLHTFSTLDEILSHAFYGLGLYLHLHAPAAKAYAEASLAEWRRDYAGCAPRTAKQLYMLRALPPDWMATYVTRSAQWWPPPVEALDVDAWVATRTEGVAAERAAAAATVEDARARRLAAVEARLRASQEQQSA